MRGLYGLTILSLCFAAAAGLVVAGCASSSHSSSSGGGNSNCSDACDILYQGCSLSINDANGNALTQSQCTSSCNSSGLSACVATCNTGAKENGDCAAFANCIDNCTAGD
jgi:hypothetical protein